MFNVKENFKWKLNSRNHPLSRVRRIEMIHNNNEWRKRATSSSLLILVCELWWLAKNSRMFICNTQFVSLAWNRAHITMMMMVMMIVLFINQLEASYRMRSSNLLFMLSASQKQHGPREKLNMKHKWCFFYKYQTLIFSLFFCLNLEFVVKHFRWQWFFKNEQKECKSASHENAEKSKQNKNLVLIIIRYLPFPLEKHEFSTNAPMFIFSMKKINQTNNIKWLGPSRIWTRLTDNDTVFSISEWFNIRCFLLT